MQTVHVRLQARRTNYAIRIGNGLLAEAGEQTPAALGPAARRTALISNKKVFDLFGGRVSAALRAANFEVTTWLMKDGEPNKSLRSLEHALTFISTSGLERTD